MGANDVTLGCRGDAHAADGIIAYEELAEDSGTVRVVAAVAVHDVDAGKEGD